MEDWWMERVKDAVRRHPGLKLRQGQLTKDEIEEIASATDTYVDFDRYGNPVFIPNDDIDISAEIDFFDAAQEEIPPPDVEILKGNTK